MFKNDIYKQELKAYVQDNQDLFQLFRNKRILITGAAGCIGSYIIDLFISANRFLHIPTTIYAIDQNNQLLKDRFPTEYCDMITPICEDINSEDTSFPSSDYVIHAASNTSPIDYVEKPISTIRTNVIGTDRLLCYCAKQKVERFLFCSSVEAYGRNNGDVDEFDEEYSGYVNSNSLRAGYPSSKRAGEALCNAYHAEYPFLSFVIARIGRIYGLTIVPGDTKAPSQFIDNAVNGENVIMKSDGIQEYSYCYVGDCAIALLFLLLKGQNGEAYNVADPNSRIRLRDFASYAAKAGNTKIESCPPTVTEESGYSNIRKAVLAVNKLQSLGWSPKYDAESGIHQTIKILKEMRRNNI